MRWLMWLCLFVTSVVRGETEAPLVSAEIPITLRDGLLWAEVRTAGHSEPLRFLVDSGASVSVLDLGAARRLGLKFGRKVKVSAVGVTVAGYWPTRARVHAGSVALPEDLLVVDLSRLAKACSRPVEGLIGADFFRGRIVAIDYAGSRLRLLEAPPADGDFDAVPLEQRPCGFRVPVSVNGGATQWVRVDTGCATAFQWVKRNKLPEVCAAKPAIGLAELSIPQITTRVRLGRYEALEVPTGLHRRPIFPGESGLLGNGFLAGAGTIVFNTSSGRLLLKRVCPPANHDAASPEAKVSG